MLNKNHFANSFRFTFHLARLIEQIEKKNVITSPELKVPFLRREEDSENEKGRQKRGHAKVSSGLFRGIRSSYQFPRAYVLAGTMSNTQGVLCLPTLLLAQQARVPKSVSAVGVYSRTLTSPLLRALEFGIGNTSPRVPLYVQENLTASFGTASTSQRSDTVSWRPAVTSRRSWPARHLGASARATETQRSFVEQEVERERERARDLSRNHGALTFHLNENRRAPTLSHGVDRLAGILAGVREGEHPQCQRVRGYQRSAGHVVLQSIVLKRDSRYGTCVLRGEVRFIQFGRKFEAKIADTYVSSFSCDDLRSEGSWRGGVNF